MNEPQVPQHMNCNNQEVLVCDYFILKACPETCAYSKKIRTGYTEIEDMLELPRGLEGDVSE